MSYLKFVEKDEYPFRFGSDEFLSYGKEDQKLLWQLWKDELAKAWIAATSEKKISPSEVYGAYSKKDLLREYDRAMDEKRTFHELKAELELPQGKRNYEFEVGRGITEIISRGMTEEEFMVRYSDH